MNVEYSINYTKTKSISIGVDVNTFQPLIRIGHGLTFCVQLNLSEWKRFSTLFEFISEYMNSKSEITVIKSLGEANEVALRTRFSHKMAMLQKKGGGQRETVYFSADEWKLFIQLLPCVQCAVDNVKVLREVVLQCFTYMVNAAYAEIQVQCIGCKGLQPEIHTCIDKDFVRNYIPKTYPQINSTDGKRLLAELKYFCLNKIVDAVHNKCCESVYLVEMDVD